MATRYLEAAGGRIAYEVTGPPEGRGVVLVHGMGDTRASFRFLARSLAEEGYRVAAMDVRGYGESSTGWPNHDVAPIGEDVLALARELGGPVTVVAHSIGCASAVWAAVREPALVTELVLIGSFSGDTPIKPWMRAASRAVGRSAYLWGVFLRSCYPSARPADFDAYVRAVKANLREPGRRAALRAQIEVSLSGVATPYAEVRCPALVVMGTRDRDFADPAAEARAIAGRLGGPAEVLLVEGAGHYPHAEMPQVTAAAIVGALAHGPETRDREVCH
ncbi:alpha/beta fold hydrolase [Sphaerisporangium dianthi]|uniref:Alpha/beta fold hydrolase n=1 Tax=Sphaerisporangium dianthi TaxID=1436120 RepID=A0ABV9CF96_9ACTN